MWVEVYDEKYRLNMKLGRNFDKVLGKIGKYKILVNRYGDKWWCQNSVHHDREDGPALVRCDGHEEWYLNGLLHRKGGPAITAANGAKWWYRNGVSHREDGPAFEIRGEYKAWYLNGECLTEEQHQRRVSNE